MWFINLCQRYFCGFTTFLIDLKILSLYNHYWEDGEHILKQRLKELRKILNLTQQEFSNRIGIKRNNIACYETGKNTPSDAVIALICREFNVNENWLRTGEGDMFLDSDRKSEIDKLTNLLLNEESASFKSRFVNMLANLTVEEWAFLEKIALELVSSTNIDNDINKTPSKAITSDLEMEYKKSNLRGASKTDATASNITEDTEKRKNIANK